MSQRVFGLVKFLAFFIVCTLILGFFAERQLDQDMLLHESKNWLANQVDVKNELGGIIEITTRKRLSFNGDNVKKAYNQYTLHVRGEKNTAVVIVRVDPHSSDVDKYKIYSMKVVQ